MKKSDIIIKIKEDHFDQYGISPELVAIAPGRVNIIGEHTDYNDGFAMPVAINKYVFVSISLNSDYMLNAYSDEMKSKISVPINDMTASESWHQYILGAVNEIFKNYSIHHGLDISIYSNLLVGKGISSSAALEVALVNGILNLFNINETDEKIIRICQKIDHKYIGIKSGILDQSASQLSKKDKILKIDFSKNSFTYIDLSFSDCSWVLIDSSIKRELASSKYHERVQECNKGLSLISNFLGKKINWGDISADKLSILTDSHPILSKRIQHVIDENRRVVDMELAIGDNNLERIGELLISSHNSLKDLYEVSCKEIDYLISISSDLEYWYGGRIMGGGFGGNTINLVKRGREDEYSEFIRERYKNKFNLKANMYNIEFSSGVEIIDNISAD